MFSPFLQLDSSSTIVVSEILPIFQFKTSEGFLKTYLYYNTAVLLRLSIDIKWKGKLEQTG